MSKALVLVTGPSGFVGAHVFDALLRKGYRVRGTIRSHAKSEYLKKKYASTNYANDISFTIIPDIQAVGALDDAVQDVEYICHVASPYFILTNDPIKELVEPAVNGTKNVINSALKAPMLKRLTVLSSFASVNDVFKNPRPGYTYTEADWDPVTLAQAAQDGMLGYHASKTFAERAAWDLWKEAKPSWDLVALCPPMIYGPPIHEVHLESGIEGLNTSVKRLMEGITGRDPNFKPGVATPGLPHWVDVRDVAKAHVSTLELPAKISERFLLCSSAKYYEDGLAGLRARGVKGLGEEGQKCDPAKHFEIDSSKAKKMLQFEPIGFQKTVEDVWEKMVELGFVKEN
jgi:nucleoside-diphosphate-sugar epimerase